MGRIRQLPEVLAHQIAAGEVIERPASVVKELVENSIDARAGRIEVEIADGGKEFIRVRDDGIGMDRQDLELAFKRHATSKIASVDDLFAIATLGFRGEALPSIASVSNLELRSRVRGSACGHRVVATDQAHMKVEPVAMDEGTTVDVRQLFYNTPARFRFLKTSPTEKRYIAELFTDLCIAHPDIAFKLTADEKVVLQTSGRGELQEVLSTVYGVKVGKQLLPLAAQTPWGELHGYLGPPNLARRNRRGQTFMVNGRVIKSYLMVSAVEKGYQGTLGQRQYPLAVVGITIRPSLVDVNVHPTKAEIRFQEEQQLYQDVHSAVKQCLLHKDLSATFADGKGKGRGSAIDQQQMDFGTNVGERPLSWGQALIGRRGNATQDGVNEEPPKGNREADHRFRQSDVANSVTNETPVLATDADSREQLSTARILGQLSRTYILLEVATDLWILDQHVVHERILYERFLQPTDDATQLLLPQTLEFSAKDAARVEERLSELKCLGIELESFGAHSFVLRSLPTELVGLSDWEQELVQIVGHIENHDTYQRQAAIIMACKGAVKAGQSLEASEMRNLLQELACTENPFTCPHGRPIIVRLEEGELLRRFGRGARR